LHGRQPPVIHRDLKCDNVFVTGISGQVKIGDLGLATLKKTSFAKSVIGTPEFMAPEMYSEQYDESIDVYAFGMCLLEMATGEYPYQECTKPFEIYKRVTSGIRPDNYNRIDDDDLKELIDLCIRQKKSQRPTVKDLVNHSWFMENNGLKLELHKDLENNNKIYSDESRVLFRIKVSDKTKRKNWPDNEAIEFIFDLEKDNPEHIVKELRENINKINDDDMRYLIQAIKDKCLVFKLERIEEEDKQQLQLVNNNNNTSNSNNSLSTASTTTTATGNTTQVTTTNANNTTTITTTTTTVNNNNNNNMNQVAQAPTPSQTPTANQPVCTTNTPATNTTTTTATTEQTNNQQIVNSVKPTTLNSASINNSIQQQQQQQQSVNVNKAPPVEQLTNPSPLQQQAVIDNKQTIKNLNKNEIETNENQYFSQKNPLPQPYISPVNLSNQPEQQQQQQHQQYYQQLIVQQQQQQQQPPLQLPLQSSQQQNLIHDEITSSSSSPLTILDSNTDLLKTVNKLKLSKVSHLII